MIIYPYLQMGAATDDGDQSALVSFINHVLHLFECMYDPYHIWRKYIMK